MKKQLLILMSVLFLTGMISTVSVAQTKVTFIVNTATISDTINATSKVAVTGSATQLGPWNDGVMLTNVGGDYWQGQVSLIKGDTVKFKYRANGGWEDGDDHTLIVGASDTTLPIMFYNATGTKQVDYWKPYRPTSADSFSVWFRVNMKVVMENAAFGWTAKDKDSVAVRGDGGGGNDLDWGISFYLKQEKNPNFFSGRLRFPKASFPAGKEVQYKYLLGYNWGRDELAGGKPNRSFKVPIGQKDTTLAYVYFNNDQPIPRVNGDTCIVTFNVDMKTATNTKGFSQGDTVVVESGYFGSAVEPSRRKTLKLSIGTLYTVTDTIITAVNKPLDYQYYLIKNGVDVREYYFNFDYTGTSSAEQERRQVSVASKKFTVSDNVVGTSIARRQPRFPSQTPLKQAVTVKWVLDLRPAYAQVKAGTVLKDGQGTSDVVVADSIKKWGVGINGPATNLPTVYPVSDWAPWDAANLAADTSKRKMWDDGTHGDVKAGDTLYTVTYTYPAGSNAGKVSKYGIRGGDNETGFGLNHLDNIDDTNPTATLYVAWGSINPKFYSAWDYNAVTAVADNKNVLPVKYALDQNYPNPFNPSTKIQFALPVQSDVTLTVFNIVGQQVATLINGHMNAGVHVAEFDASKLSSGVYFYRISAGNFISVKKMLLMK
ncbi:MAG TPA: T9SS type A sorting domain-containing protein [Bacteroidota bacterium]|nr:T9SS type A sorting domain-containing protein [Bacteroidota bacterium]